MSSTAACSCLLGASLKGQAYCLFELAPCSQVWLQAANHPNLYAVLTLQSLPGSAQEFTISLPAAGVETLCQDLKLDPSDRKVIVCLTVLTQLVVTAGQPALLWVPHKSHNQQLLPM